MKSFFNTWGLLILSALLDTYAGTVVKARFNQLGKLNTASPKEIFSYLLQFFHSPLLFSALAVFLIAPAVWFFALSRMELSTAYPLLVAFHLLFVLLFGLSFLGESLSLNKVAGIILVLGGMYFFYRS